MQEQQVITAEMSIGEVISKYPDTIHVFFKHGLGCVGCAVAGFENIRQGAVAHGIERPLPGTLNSSQRNLPAARGFIAATAASAPAIVRRPVLCHRASAVHIDRRWRAL